MARTRTLTELIAEVRQRATMPSTNFCPDSEITRYINQSYTRFRALVSIHGDHDFYLKDPPGTVTTAAGTSTYSLPNDFVALKGADVNLGSSEVKILHPYNFIERNKYPLSAGWYGDGPIAYRLFANKIGFVPEPTGVHTVTLHYVPVQTDLSAGGDTIDGINGWEEWIVLDAACKCLEKQRTENPFSVERMNQIRAEIMAEVSARDMGEPQQIQDVTGRWDHYWGI